LESSWISTLQVYIYPTCLCKDFAKLEHKSPEYLANEQPFGKIPVLHDGDYKIYESRAIARYIADNSTNTEVYPRDAKTRGLVEQWISVEQSYFAPAEAIVGQLVFAPY
jgi:glutathione S-transferase